MQTFQLNIQPELQGKFVAKSLNLAFVFQVNCPGCFIHGIPLINQLYEAFGNDVGFIGVSTAFEDFELNTRENTIDLLRNGTLVSETKKYFSENFDQVNYPIKIEFPVTFDQMLSQKELTSEKNVNSFCSRYSNFHRLPQNEQQEAKESVINYFRHFDQVGSTFALNQLRGTPSFVLFDRDFVVLNSSFGNQSFTNFKEMINGFLG